MLLSSISFVDKYYVPEEMQENHGTRMTRVIIKPYGEKLSVSEPVRCHKCGKPLGYVTVLGRRFASFQQPIKSVKIVATCMECAQKKE